MIFLCLIGGMVAPAGSQRKIHPPSRSLADAARRCEHPPEKPRADILLVGHARAPGGVPVPSLVARLRVGTLVKTLHVEGDRVWTAAPEGLRPSPSRPFTAMPLRYERAPLGPENPIGVDQSPQAIRPGWPLANIYPVGETKPGAVTPSFGPSAPAWRGRRLRNGRDIAR